MIFCTVGTQLPFDRLVNYLLQWRNETQYKDIVFQVGRSDEFSPDDGFNVSIDEPDFSHRFEQAEIIVSHAGMGNIIRALDLNKAIVVVPRQSALGEHVNNHQLDTVDSLGGLPNLFYANDYESFCRAMERATRYQSVGAAANGNLQNLIDAVSDFVVR